MSAGKTTTFRPDGAPKGIYGTDGKPKFFDNPEMDRVIAVIMNLAQEAWIQEERILALEDAKSDKEVDREAKLNEFIGRVFRPMRVD